MTTRENFEGDESTCLERRSRALGLDLCGEGAGGEGLWRGLLY